MNDTVVYTTIIGPVDSLTVPSVKPEGYDLVCFTDQDIESNHYKIIKVSSYLHPIYHHKRYKMLPHWFFPQYKYSIYTDASMQICGKLDAKKTLGGKAVAFHKHPDRNCIYKEAEACIEKDLDDPKIITAQMDRYRAEGYPENNRLIVGWIIYREHNTLDSKMFGNMWYMEVFKYSIRDQLSANRILTKLYTDYAILDSTGIDNGLFNRKSHTGIRRRDFNRMREGR